LLEAEHIAPKRLPIALTVASVDRMTMAHPQTTFSELLGGDRRPQTLVATLLACLELSARGSVLLSQEEDFGEIDVVRVEGAPPYEAGDATQEDYDGAAPHDEADMADELGKDATGEERTA